MTKLFSMRPLALMALTGLFYGCQQDELQPSSSTLKTESRSLSQVENCDVINFENSAGFQRDANGFITGVLSQHGASVQVSGFARVSTDPSELWGTQNRANIFDTSNPGAWDEDLSTPGWANNIALGNVLVVQELVAPNNDVTQPNDNAHGSRMVLDFSAIGPVTVNAMTVLDIEEHTELRSRVDFFDAANNKINAADIMIAPTGNNGVGVVNFADMKGVMKMVVTMDGSWNETTNAGSGAIDNISFCRDTPPTPCAPCEGKVSQLTFRYNGPDNATLVATARLGAERTPLLSISDLDAGETFTLDGLLHNDPRNGFAGTLGTEVVLVAAVNGQVTTTTIHTSCSQPIYQSYANGLYTTLAGSSKIGGPLCSFARVLP